MTRDTREPRACGTIDSASFAPFGLDETPENVWVVQVRGNAYLCVVHGQTDGLASFLNENDAKNVDLRIRLGGQGYFGAQAHLKPFNEALDMAKCKNKDGLWLYADDQYLVQPPMHYVR